MQSRLQPRKSVRTVKLRPRPCLRRHAVRCRLGIADPQAEEHHRKRCPDETEAVVRDFKLRFGSFVNQLSRTQRSARQRKRMHAYLTQVFGHHLGIING